MLELLVFAAMLGVPVLALVGGAAGVARRKRACPACGRRALGTRATRRIYTGGRSSIERMFGCAACGGAFMQLANGPLVPKPEWDAVKRPQLPPARLINR